MRDERALQPPRFVAVDDVRLPQPLREVQPGLPGLWVAGDADCLGAGVRIGIIGSRRPRADSVEFARRIATGAARCGMTVVSGLAIGVDGLAHRFALEAGGDTIAVLPRGLDHVYPPRNAGLARQIAGAGHGTRGVSTGTAPRGAVVSEYAPHVEDVHRGQFLARNRVIAALSDYLVVVQAHEHSGSMNTATAALDLGVPIGVVPSGTDDPGYAGSIALIRDGADCVVDARSLVHRLLVHGVLGPAVREAVPDRSYETIVMDPAAPGGVRVREAPRTPVLFDHPLASILVAPRTTDEVAERAGIDLRDARRMLVELECAGAARSTPDGCWVASTGEVE